MHSKKTILSILLLSVYTIGLAHNVIPHCHHDKFRANHSAEHAAAHNHTHIPLDAENPTDHSLFLHNDHLDAGFLDFILCWLHETDHPDSQTSDSFCLPQITGLNSGSWLLITSFKACFLANIEQANKKVQRYYIPEFLSDNISSLYAVTVLLRGPPSSS